MYTETSVLIVDDPTAFVDALRSAIDREPDILCVGVVHSALDAIETIDRERPDHCLLDLDLRGACGLDVLRVIREAAPGVAITVLTSSADPHTVVDAELAGANHFLPTRCSLADVLDALRSPIHGRMTLPGSVVLDLFRQHDALDRHDIVGGLTSRELDVLRGMAAGDAPKVIAHEMGLSVHTVRGHVKNIYWKLDAHSQLEAVAIARRRGLLSTVA